MSVVGCEPCLEPTIFHHNSEKSTAVPHTAISEKLRIPMEAWIVAHRRFSKDASRSM